MLRTRRGWHFAALAGVFCLGWSCDRLPPDTLSDNRNPLSILDDKISGGSNPCAQPGNFPDIQARDPANSIAESEIDYVAVSGPQYGARHLRPKFGTTEFAMPDSHLVIHHHATGVAILHCLRQAIAPCMLPSMQFPMVDVHLKPLGKRAGNVVKFTLVSDEDNQFPSIMLNITDNTKRGQSPCMA